MTRTEYLEHAVARARRGSSQPSAKLDEAKVRHIRTRLRHRTHNDVAAMYGVHKRTIEKLRSFETWTHVR